MKEGIRRKEMVAELQGYQPLKSLSTFMKNISQKIPKESQIRKHGRKISNFNNKH
jgi:hypothetical protein